MSVKQMMLVWEHQFPHPQQLVMLALADHAHDDGSKIYPSLDYLAWKTGYCRRSVQNIIGDLRASGVLQIAREANHNTPNEYAFDWSKALTKQPFERGARAVKEAPNRGAVGVHEEPRRGAVAVHEGCSRGAEGCSSGAGGVQPVAPEPSLTVSKNHQEPSPPTPPSTDPEPSARTGEYGSNLLQGQYPEAFRQLAKVKSVANVNTGQFQAWCSKVLSDCRAHGSEKVAPVLAELAVNYSSFSLPWKWYAKQISSLTAEQERYFAPRGPALPALRPGDDARTPDGTTHTILDITRNGMVVFEDDAGPYHLKQLAMVGAAA